MLILLPPRREKAFQPSRNPWHDLDTDAKRRVGHGDWAGLGLPACHSCRLGEMRVDTPRVFDASGTVARNIYLVQAWGAAGSYKPAQAVYAAAPTINRI